MNEVKTSTNEAGHRILTVTTAAPTVEATLTWTWNLTQEPDAFMHASTEVIRTLCQHVFLVEADRDQWRRRAETAAKRVREVADEFTKRLDKMEAQVTKVRALHARVYGSAGDEVWGRSPRCDECRVAWPCPTLQALVSDPTDPKEAQDG